MRNLPGHPCQDNPRKRLLWGITLITLGCVFLLDRMALLDLTQLLGPQTRWWHFVPLVVALGGAISVVSAQSARQVIKGLGTFSVGIWVFACLEQINGLSFANSWPIVLIIWGAEILMRGWWGDRSVVRNEVAQ